MTYKKGKIFGVLNFDLRPHPIDGSLWIVENYAGAWGYVTSYGCKCVPLDGRETDLASVPFLFRRLLPNSGDGKKGNYRFASVIHDELYKTGYVVDINGIKRPLMRVEADFIMKDIMQQMGVSAWRVNFIYFALRIGAWYTWNNYRKADNRKRK